MVRTFPGRTFHDLVTLSRLATWGLGPLPTAENLSHEEVTRRSKCRPSYSIISALFSFDFLFFFLIFLINFSRHRDKHNEGKQGKNSG